MQLHFFVIPAMSSQAAQLELNRFCTAHRVVAVDRHFRRGWREFLLGALRER